MSVLGRAAFGWPSYLKNLETINMNHIIVSMYRDVGFCLFKRFLKDDGQAFDEHIFGREKDTEFFISPYYSRDILEQDCQYLDRNYPQEFHVVLPVTKTRKL